MIPQLLPKVRLLHEPVYVILCVVNLTEQKPYVSVFGFPTGV
jgi:hypothetical protein